MVVKKRILYFLFVIIIFSLVGCSNKPTKDDEKAKINEELNYLDTKIVSILNKLNNISLQNYTITSEEVNLGEKGGSSGKNAEKFQYLRKSDQCFQGPGSNAL